MKFKKVLLSLILLAALPFTLKVSARGKLGLFTTKDCVLVANPNDHENYIKMVKNLDTFNNNFGIVIKFNDENQTPQISNVFYLQIFSKLITNVFIDNIKEKYGKDLSEFKIKDYKNIDLNNPLFVFTSYLIPEKNQKPTLEIFKKLVNSKDWNFHLSKDVIKKLSEQKLFDTIGRYLGYIIETGLDKVYTTEFQPKIEKYIEDGKLNEILDGIIGEYNKLKDKPDFKEKHPEYPDGFIEEINRIKGLTKKDQKEYFEKVLFKMSFEINGNLKK